MPNYGTQFTLVDDQEAQPNRTDKYTGTSGDLISSEQAFAAQCYLVMVKAETNDLDITLVADDGTDADAITVTKNSQLALSFRARGFKHNNTTPGSNADYTVIGFYKA
jgi:hypothetical protein